LDRNAVWSPDGRQIVFHSNRTGVHNLYIKSTTGGAAAETILLESPQDESPSDWSADGRFILYYSRGPETDQDLWVLPMEGTRQPFLFLRTKFNERHARFSPDGRWVAYMSNESGRTEIYVRPFVIPAPENAKTLSSAGGMVREDTAMQWQVSTTGGIFPQWSRDGRELYYIGPDAQMMAVPVPAGTTFELSEPVALFQTRIVGGGEDVAQGPQFDVTQDGRFLINTVVDDSAAPIIILQNWTADVNK
jgi:Tol biopolymer transport system component